MSSLSKVIMAVALCLLTGMPPQAMGQPMPIHPPRGAPKLPLGTPLVTIKLVRMHTQPHWNAKIISVLPPDTSVALDGAWGASWVQIRYRDQVGYVVRSTVRPVQ